MFYIEEQLKLHPSMEAQDIIKMCYQAAFGAEHLISDMEKAREYLDEEYSAVSATDEPLYERISHEVIRVNLGAWKKIELPQEWLFKLFILSAKVSDNANKTFAEYVDKAMSVCPHLEAYYAEYLKDGVRPVHHSSLYRECEKPHYRVVSSRLISVIEILRKINSTNAKIIAIDGRAASGKSTMADALKEILGAALIHMDDFYLPLNLRTASRFKEIGGNIHYERFISEVLSGIRSNKDFSYSVFDCSIMDYSKEQIVSSAPYIIVEGAYSHHPRFGDYADLKVFSHISCGEQMSRIIGRNGERMAEVFHSKWIPMEEAYYKEFMICEKADLVVG